MQNFGLRLKKLRENKGLTIKELAEIVNCHHFILRDWENGDRVLTTGVIIRLAKFFGVTTDYLLGLE